MNIAVFVPVFYPFYDFWLLAGRPALILIYIAVAAGILRKKIPKYWKQIHFLNYVALFFGLIHGFGFSNYFNMLMSGEEEKLSPLLGFATGIELSQVLIVLAILTLAYLLQSILRLKQEYFIRFTSILIICITIPMLVRTFPW